MGVSEKLPSRRPPLPHTRAEDSLDELEELARSAGATVEAKVIQMRERLDPATLLGRGKLERIHQLAAEKEANLLIVDFDLTPTQQRNIEELAECRVVDRTQLILDIFARHAHTREGQLQVELAQLNYLLPRLTGRGVEMSRLGGGIGTRGPGETQLEMDRRRIRRRIRALRETLETVRQQRRQRRSRRETVPIATLPLVGYTNAGKSTLFNRLTQAEVRTSPQMFATLDPTLRLLELPSRRRVLVSDTVGFIRNLPHTLVQAFRATLEEVSSAHMILMVSDCAAPDRAEREAQVEKVLEEIGASQKPLLRIWNKSDLLGPEERGSLRPEGDAVLVSAKTGEGIEDLRRAMDHRLPLDPIVRVRLTFSQEQGRELSQLYEFGRVLEREDLNGFVRVEAEVPQSLLARLRKDQSTRQTSPR